MNPDDNERKNKFSYKTISIRIKTAHKILYYLNKGNKDEELRTIIRNLSNVLRVPAREITLKEKRLALRNSYKTLHYGKWYLRRCDCAMGFLTSAKKATKCMKCIHKRAFKEHLHTVVDRKPILNEDNANNFVLVD